MIFLIVYASTNISKLNDQKNSWDKLTLSSWNNLVAKVDELIDRVNAWTSNWGWWVWLPTEISDESSSSVNLANAIKWCREMTGWWWRLPTQEELALFIGIDWSTTNDLWTRTVFSDL